MIALGAVARADQHAYTLGDLKALATQHAWRELVEHLEDVAPANRDGAWRAVAQQAGLGLLADVTHTSPADALGVVEALLARYPTLKDSKEFMARRAELGAAAFDRCFRAKLETADACALRLPGFVAEDPANAELAFRLAKLLPARSPHQYAVTAFALAIPNKDDPRCKDPDVRLAVIAALGLPRATNDELVTAGLALGMGVCWSALNDAILAAMGGGSPDLLANTCAPMKSRRALSPLLAKRCDKPT